MEFAWVRQLGSVEQMDSVGAQRDCAGEAAPRPIANPTSVLLFRRAAEADR